MVAVKQNARVAIAKIDAQIKQIHDENQEIVLKLRKLEGRKKIVLEKFNARLAHLTNRLKTVKRA